MSQKYGPVSVMAYAAVVVWAFWRLMTMGMLTGWVLPVLPLMLIALVGAKHFAALVHGRLS